MPFIESNARPIYFERHGKGEPLLFLHGAGSNAAAWWQQLAVFAKTHRCYTMDIRCFGRSVAPLEEFIIDLFVADILALLNAEGIPTITLIGQSLGGMVALRTTLNHPERVSHLALFDSPLGTDHPKQLEYMNRRLNEAAGMPIEQRSLGKWFLENKPDLAALYAQINHFNPNAYLEQKEAWKQAMQRLSQPEQLVPFSALKTIKCPTLLVVGEHDPIVPVDIMQDVQALIADSQLCVVADAAHSAYFEKADVVNAALKTFL